MFLACDGDPLGLAPRDFKQRLIEDEWRITGASCACHVRTGTFHERFTCFPKEFCAMTSLPHDQDVPLRSHPLSNDLTTEALAKPGPVERSDERQAAVPRKERRVLGRVAMFVGGAAVLAVIIAAFLFPRPDLFIIGAVVILAYGLLLIAPVILADSTKVAQDEAVREQKAGTSAR
jgi:hypothetical protein